MFVSLEFLFVTLLSVCYPESGSLSQSEYGCDGIANGGHLFPPQTRSRSSF